VPHYPQELTLEGKARQRRAEGGATGALQRVADKLVCMLVYHKTKPWHTAHALPCGVSQPQAHSWMPHVLPSLRDTLDALGMKPERDARRVAHYHLALEGGPALAIDGTERRRQRPADATKHKEHDSGKTKTPTDKNLLLVNEQTGKVVSLSPTVAGTRHDKKMADEAAIAYPANAPLAKETGFQG